MKKASLFTQDGRFAQAIEGDLDLVIIPTAKALGYRWALGDFGPDHKLTERGVERCEPPNLDLTYGEQRAAAYPSIRDQLGALGKMASALRDQGFTMPDEVNDWIDSLAAVKSQYPKET